MKMHIFLLFFCILFFENCQKTDNSEKNHIENSYNFGFESVWNDKMIMPWRLSFSENYLIDSTNSRKGNYSIYVQDGDSIDLKGFVYMNSFPVPSSVENIEISCYARKEGEGQDTFSLIAFSYDAPKENNYILTFDSSLVVQGGKDWKEYNLQVKKENEFNSILFGFETKGTADYWIDDFDLKYDGVSVQDYSFFTKEDVDLLESNAIPFEKKSLQEEVDDLYFLSKFAKDKQIVGLGEANHGTREIFQIKSRVIKYLIENEGFNTIVFEDMMEELHHVNDYIMDEQNLNSIDSIMPHFLHLFQVEAIRDLVVWLKAYNKGKNSSEKVLFLGCDIQKNKATVQFLKNFAKKQDAVLLDLVLAYEEEYRVYENIDVIKQIQSHLEKKRGKYNIPELMYKRLLQSSVSLEQFAIFDANLGNRSIHRDSSMANNLLWILDTYPNRKAFYWADNHHVKKKQITATGGYLANALGEKYYVIGTALGKGTTLGKGKKELPLAPRLFPSRREYYLNIAKDSIYYLPLEEFSVKLQNQVEDFESKNKEWEFDYFDAIIHIENASAVRLLN